MSSARGGGEAGDRDGARTFRLVLEYDGRAFEGWQIQSGARAARTVQGVLAEAVESVTRTPARVRGAGRTDAGVHALGQVASLVVGTRLSAVVLGRAIGSRLPADLAVVRCDEVPADWDALREAQGKHYRYQIWNGTHRSPTRAPRWCWIRDRLNLADMGAAARTFVGRHDFAAFKAAGSDTRTTIRTLSRLAVTGVAGGEIVLDVEGEGFLRHMVRNLAGTLIEVGRGRWEPERVQAILASGDRGQAGPTAPAEALTLVAVRDSWTSGEVGNFGMEERATDRSVRPLG